MKKMLAVFLSFCLAAAAAAETPCPKWPHSKKYPCEVLKVLSPTEFQIKLLEDGKTYTLRLAHVKPVEKKKIPKDFTNADIYKTYEGFAFKTVSSMVSPVLEKDSKPQKTGDAVVKKSDLHAWVEFEKDDIEKDGSKLLGYLFVSDREDFPVNARLIAIKLKKNRSFVVTSYMQENGVDSKSKAVFEWAESQDW